MASVVPPPRHPIVPPPPDPPDLSSAASQVIETHISTLLLEGDRVYKRKKPVRFGFVDFSTPDRRRAACHREVALNRRLAPTVYLGVADVPDDHGRLEPAVVMRRMDPARRLATLVATDPAAAAACVDALADLLAAFHATAERSPAIDAAATATSVRAVWDDSTDEMARFVGPVLDPAVVDDVTVRYRRFLDGRAPLFDERIAAGWVRDGHGDLQAEDVFCTDDGPQVLDCIEFDDRLRYGDVLADVAFAAMDLERLGAPGLARRLVARWALGLGDPAVVHPALLHHYVASRAHVRAKVACLRWSQHPPDGAAAHDAAAAARALLDQCAMHLAAAEVRLVLVGGSPGTGKTTLAAALAGAQGWELRHSDVVRKQLAGVALDARAPGAGVGDAGLYRPEQVAATYEALRAGAAVTLERGRSVVLDASWTSADERRRAAALARVAGATLVELRCVCDPAVARQRVADRPAGAPGASDATPEVADLLAARAESWPGAVEIDTSGDPAQSLAVAVAAVGPGGWDVGRAGAND